MRRLATSEEGFGLVELLIAMTVMSIAIVALVAGFSSGFGTINRASKTATAGVIADKQMEAFTGKARIGVQVTLGLDRHDRRRVRRSHLLGRARGRRSLRARTRRPRLARHRPARLSRRHEEPPTIEARDRHGA